MVLNSGQSTDEDEDKIWQADYFEIVVEALPSCPQLVGRGVMGSGQEWEQNFQVFEPMLQFPETKRKARSDEDPLLGK